MRKGRPWPPGKHASGRPVAAAASQWVANWVFTSFPPLKDTGLALAYGLYTISVCALLTLRSANGTDDRS